MHAPSHTKVGRKAALLWCVSGVVLLLFCHMTHNGLSPNVYMRVHARRLSSVPLSQRDPSIPFGEQVGGQDLTT